LFTFEALAAYDLLIALVAGVSGVIAARVIRMLLRLVKAA